jgi:hypothetical protein
MASSQTTPEELERKLDQRIQKLEEGQIPEPAAELVEVNGASAQTQARGAAALKPNSRRVVPLPYFTPSCRLLYEGLPEGEVKLRTGAARLIQVGDTWHEPGLIGPWTGEHYFESGGGTVSLALHLPRNTTTAVMPPAPTSGEQKRDQFEVPPAATKIRGKGTLEYFTGHTIEISGERLLKRPLADGSLGVRPGGVYAEMHSHEPPEFRIGQTWITAKPRTERPAS